MWCSVHLGHDGPASELDEGMDWWYKEKKAGIYKRASQYKDSVQVAWLLYSHEKVDRKFLIEKLDTLYVNKWKKKAPMALSWTQIKDSTFNASKKKTIQAKLTHMRYMSIAESKIRKTSKHTSK